MSGPEPVPCAGATKLEGRRVGSVRLWVTAVAIALCYVIVGCVTLDAFPRVWMDEPWYTQSAWSFTQNGDFALPMFADLAGFDHDNVIYGRAYLLAVAGAFEIAGVGPFGARLASFVSALVALVAVLGVGRELWGARVGIVAALLLAVAPSFVLQSHDARPELALVAAWTVGLYLLLSGVRVDSRWRLALAGLMAVLAADTHLNGSVVPAALLVVLLYRRVPRSMLAAYMGGVAAGAAWWAVAHLRDPQLFYDQLVLYSRGAPYLDLLSKPVIVFGSEAIRYIMVQPPASTVLLALAVVAVPILLLWHRDAAVMSVLLFALTVWVFLALASGADTPIYAIILWPIVALLVARLLDTWNRPAAVAVTTLVVLISLVQVGVIALREAPADYDRYVARLRAAIPKGAIVQGQEPTWFGFVGEPFTATHYFTFVGPYEDEVRRLGIEYIIADEFFLDVQLHELGNIDADEVETFLENHTSLVAEVIDPYYGRTQHGGGTPPYTTRILRVHRDPMGATPP